MTVIDLFTKGLVDLPDAGQINVNLATMGFGGVPDMHLGNVNLQGMVINDLVVVYLVVIFDVNLVDV